MIRLKRRGSADPRSGSQPLLGQIAETMDDAVWVGSPDMVEIESVNRAFEKLWGRSAQEVYESSQVLSDGVHPDDRDRVLATLAAHPDDEWTVECRVVRPDGSERWIEARGFAVGSGSDGGAWRAGICRDITDRVDAESRLRVQEEFFAKVNQLAGVIGWEIDVETGHVAWNDQLAELLEVPLGKTRLPDVIFDDYIHPEDRPTVISAGERASAIGEPTEITFRMFTETGELIHVRSIGMPEEIDEKLVRRWGYVQDITESHEAEEAERAARAEAQVLLGHLELAQRMGKIGTWDFDLVTNELVWTTEEHQILGVSQEIEPTYEVFIGTVHPDDRDLVDSAFDAAVRGERPYVIEHRVLVDGKVVWIKNEATIELDSDGNAIRAIGFSQDITEQVESRTALANNE